ncbi:MAG: O-antigen ligase family protein [Candidatus Omnitrophota bacterium]|nr:O-antigen ligase family protein [Candidatus Omnitrophota bacterium]
MKGKVLKISDYILEYSLYGMIFFIPISKAAIEIFFGLALAAFLIKKVIKPDFKFLLTPPHLLLLLFFMFSALSLFNSGPYFARGLEALIAKWLEYLLIFILIEDTLNNKKKIYIAAYLFLFMAILVCIDGLWQKFFIYDFLKHKELIKVDSGPSAISASFGHYNSFGSYLVIVISLILGFLIYQENKKLRSVLYFLTAIAGICLFLTFSRGSWLGIFFSLLLMMFLSERRKIPLFIVAVFFISVCLVPLIRERFMFIFQEGGDAGRFTIWQSAFKMIQENPFLGKGVGTFMNLFSKYMSMPLQIQYAHNSFLQVWAETGIFSLLSFLSFLVVVLSKGVQTFREKQDPLLLGLVCGVFGFLIHSFFDTQLYSLQLSVLFWAMLGLIAALNRASVCWQQEE